MGITKREIASELGVSKRTIANYIGKLGLGNHVSRNGNTDILDDFAAAAIADALKNPEKPSRQPAAAAPAPDSLADSLAAQLEIERSRNAELMEALAVERDRAARAEAEAKAQLAEANASASPTSATGSRAVWHRRRAPSSSRRTATGAAPDASRPAPGPRPPCARRPARCRGRSAGACRRATRRRGSVRRTTS